MVDEVRAYFEGRTGKARPMLMLHHPILSESENSVPPVKTSDQLALYGCRRITEDPAVAAPRGRRLLEVVCLSPEHVDTEVPEGRLDPPSRLWVCVDGGRGRGGASEETEFTSEEEAGGGEEEPAQDLSQGGAVGRGCGDEDRIGKRKREREGRASATM